MFKRLKVVDNKPVEDRNGQLVKYEDAMKVNQSLIRALDEIQRRHTNWAAMGQGGDAWTIERARVAIAQAK